MTGPDGFAVELLLEEGGVEEEAPVDRKVLQHCHHLAQAQPPPVPVVQQQVEKILH